MNFSAKKFFFILFIVGLSLYAFRNLFSVYFFQDDFYVMSLAHINDIKGFLSFFIPHNDVQFYRPLSHEIFFFLSTKLFGLEYVAYHGLVICVWIGMIFLVFAITKYYFQSIRIRLFFLFLFSTSAIHYNSLYWIVNFSYILVAFFYFLAFLIYKRNIGKPKKLIVIVIVFLCGLLSNEFMVTFPIVLFLDSFLSKTIKKNLYYMTGLMLILLSYLGLRFILFKPHYDTYQFVFNKSFISSYRWFFLFFLNWAETMKDYMVTFFQVRKNFLDSFSFVWNVYVWGLLVYFICIFLLPVITILKNQKLKKQLEKDRNKFLFGIIWFLITLTPIIFVPSHISPHQGAIALFGFLLSSLTLFDLIRRYNNVVFACFSAILATTWVVTTMTTINLNDHIHWIYQRSKLSKYWVDKAKQVYPTLFNSESILINTSDKEAIVALNNGKGIQAVYNNYNLHIYFSNSSNIPSVVKVVP